MKLNRVKQISIVMAAADVVDNGLSVSRNNVPKAQADVKEWTDLLSLGNYCCGCTRRKMGKSDEWCLENNQRLVRQRDGS